nr:hypothetical protein [Tanacetum cinerariifolium]
MRSFDLQKNKIQDQQKKKMIKKSSSSENKPCCSKACKKNIDSLNKKDGVDGKLAGLLTASKDLDNLIESQRSDKIKDGLGYSAVTPPPSQLYLSPKKDLCWTGLLECADDTVTDYKEISSGGTTTRSDISLPEYEASFDDQLFSG